MELRGADGKVIRAEEARGSVVVSASARHAGPHSSIPEQGRHGVLGVNTWLSILVTVYQS